LAFAWFGTENFIGLYTEIGSFFKNTGSSVLLVNLAVFALVCAGLFWMIRRADNVSENVIWEQNSLIMQQNRSLGENKKKLDEQKAAFELELKSHLHTKEHLFDQQKFIDSIRKIQMVSGSARTLETLVEMVLSEFLDLSQSKFGFIGMVRGGGSPFLQSMEVHLYDEDGGNQGLITDRRTRAHPYPSGKINSDVIVDNSPPDPKHVVDFLDDHPPINKYVSIPLMINDRMAGVVGLANRSEGYDADFVESITPILLFCSNLIEDWDTWKAGGQTQNNVIKNILKSTRDIVISFDNSGKISTLNPPAEALFLPPLKEVETMEIGNVFDLPGWDNGRDGGFSRYLDSNAVGPKGKRTEITAKHLDGEKFPVETMFLPFETKDDWVFYAISRDLSGLDEAGEALRQAREESDWLKLQTMDIKKEIAESRQAEQRAQAKIEKIERSSRTKFELLASMSNELYTPMTAIVGFSDSLLNGAIGNVESPQQRELIEYVNDTGRKLLDYIKEALDLSGVETGRMGINPDDALAIGDYARFSAHIRREQHLTEALFQRALELDPGNPTILSNYSAFRTSIREDHEREDSLYKHAIEADPESALAHGSYALFLSDIRKHHNRAEDYYKRALKLDPKNAINLTNYAKFLTYVYNYHDRAETFFKRALESEPENIAILLEYARFLINVRKDVNQAQAWFERAIEIDPDAHYVQLEFAIFQLSNGEVRKGTLLLEEIIPELDGGDLTKALFYEFAYSGSSAERTKALEQLRILLENRERSPLFDPFVAVRRLVDDGHSDAKLLETLAQVITVRENLQALDRFPKWKALKMMDDKN
jgi:Tfp pilus assembly protein PilF/PAS domain-containing protein